MGLTIFSVSYLILLVTTIKASNSLMNFTFINDKKMTVLPMATVSSERSVLSCAVRCLNWLPPCYSFSYNHASLTCTLGTWLILLATQLQTRHTVVYTSTDVTFKMMSNGTTVTYVWLSNYKLNFTSARDDCRAKGAHLYTPKTQEKLNIFLKIFRPLNTLIWVGLNHMATAYRFVWDDDGSIYTGTPHIFSDGDPDNWYDVQRCVGSYTYYPLLVDMECYNTALFLCQINDTLQL